MSEELFGPILPIIDASLDEAIAYTAKHDHPLALYGFTNNQAEKDKILSKTNSGGVTFNDCILHMTVKDAPFGGVGASGTGAYHGSYGFEEFIHRRTVVNVPGWMEALLKFRYAPYTEAKANKMIQLTGGSAKPSFDRNGKDTRGILGGLSGLLASAVLVFALMKYKGFGVADLISVFTKRLA